MAYIIADRIKETTTTTGTGPLTLAGAVVGFFRFSSVMAIGDTCTYSVVSATLTESEAGIGTYSALNTLTRTTVQSSSNANAAVVFTSGTKDVFIGPIAGTQIPYDPVTGALNLSVNALNDVAITSPTVNQVLKYSGTEWTNQADAVNVGTVTSVSGAGTVSGLTLTGTVTSSGSLTLGGAISTLNQNTTGNAATVTTNANLTGHVTSVGNAASLGSFTSAQLAGALSDETGTGANVFATSPTLNGIIPITTGSFAHSPTTTNISSATHNLALSASAFHRMNCTTAASLTGIAPPTGIIHTDGRMIRIFNTGTANLTITHNSALSTAYSLNVSAGNRFFNVTAADIILAPNDYAEGTYDLTSNGSGSAGWRVA